MMRDEAISHVLERLPHHRDALGTAAVKRLREDTVLDGSTCARQKSVSFADGSVWQRAPYHESRASRHYGSAARVTSVTSVSAHPKSSTPMTNLRLQAGGYVVTAHLNKLQS